ncbi:ABC transporter substrate-binding protein [Enterococcus crotali]|uniref:ABC transporter substrate-binding protein n=1 Tax=Enterococcus crotali TaxID=1453587 RepID=UPI000472E6B3|nr:sugar ABC transporter substrate-binding protein [Enterococcus crotali]
MKKIIASCLLVVSGLLIVGCGGNKSGEDGSKEDKQTITYAIWDTNQEKGMKEMAAAFEKENPTIKVNVEVTPWDQYWTKLDAAATGESLPDVFWMHSNESYRYMSNGILMDLTETLKKSEKASLDNFPKNISELYALDGKQYALPKDIDTIGLWYNKKLFDEAGVSYPDESWTWDTFLEAAKKLTNEEKGVYGFTAVNNGHEGYWNFIFQNEGKIMSENHKTSEFADSKTVEAIQFYADLINKYKVSPSADQLAENKPVSFIQSGRSAMGFFGSWMLADFKENDYMKENTDVTVLPQGAKRASVYNGLGNAVAATTKHKEAALKFVDYLGSKEANLISAKTGAAIPAYKGTADEWVKSTEDYNVKAYVDMLDYAVIRPFSNETIKVETVETEKMSDLLSGEKSAEDVAKMIQTEVDDILK